MADNSNKNKRLARNTIFLYFRMFIVLFVTLYTSRVILNTLGVVDYGIYNVVAGFVSLFAFFNATLSASMQRFYNFKIGSNDETGLSKVYTTGILIHILFAVVVILLLETFGLWYVNRVMIIPDERMLATNILFQIVSLSSVLVIMQIPFVGVIMAYEKMDFYAVVSIFDVFLKLAIVIVLPLIPLDSLILYSCLLLGVNIFNIGVYVWYTLKHFKNLKITRDIERDLFREMLSFSGWNLVGTFAFILKGQGVNMLLNFFFGPIVNAARGVAYQVHGAISGFGGNVMVAYRPQLVNSYAAKEYSRTCKLFFSESKICYVLILVIAVPVIFEMDYILKLWLGRAVPSQSNVFTILALIDLLISILNTPCTQIVMATGKLKKYQIASTVVNIVLVLVCWVSLLLGFGAVSVFVVTILFSAINQIVCVFQAHKVFNFSLVDYITKVLRPCLLASVLLPMIPAVFHMYLTSDLLKIIIIPLSAIITAIPIYYYIVLDHSEKNQAKNFLLKIFARSKA